VGTGGTDGQLCAIAFPDECGNCLCEGCYDEFTECRSDIGCWAALACIDSSDIDCIEILQLAGPDSIAMALTLAVCAGANSCQCD
jgi:hypothetical protein